MSLAHDLFEKHPDWLSHTLANAGLPCPIAQVSLPRGGQIQRLGTGVLLIQPMQELGPRTILSAGIHGNETAPIEILNGMVDDILSGRLIPACPTLLILGNPEAIGAGKRFLNHNLNRLFSGAHEGDDYGDCEETRRAAQLEQFCLGFAHDDSPVTHFDLHTSIRPSRREKFALYPYLPDRTIPKALTDFLAEADIDTLLLQHTGATTFAAFTARHLNADSMTLELGRVKPFGENDPADFEGINRALRRHLRGDPVPSPAFTPDCFEVVHEILNTGNAFRFHIPDDTPNFTEYEPGTLIWEDDSDAYRVGDRPESIVFPNPHVPVGHRVGLMVRAVDSPRKKERF